MHSLLIALSPVLVMASASETFLRQIVAETALVQLRQPDPGWSHEQRDCAGLVRFAYRTAYKRLAPNRVSEGLWFDTSGHATAFADAATLLSHNFVRLGRDDSGRGRLKSADLVAFRQPGDGTEPTYHLMLVVLPVASDVETAWVIYHPGDPHADVRVGALRQLAQDAPMAWRPVPENPAFLGYFRFKEWAHEKG